MIASVVSSPLSEVDPEVIADSAWPWWIDENEVSECKQWIGDTCGNRIVHTEDMAHLNRQDWHLLFVYDSLKQHYVNHKQWMVNAGFISPADTLRNQWRMYEQKENPRTCVILRDPNATGKNVNGELWAAPLATIVGLDEYYCNGGSFKRERIAIRMRYPYAGFCTFAWLYAGTHRYFGEKTQTDKWRNSRVHTSKNTKEDYWFYRKDND